MSQVKVENALARRIQKVPCGRYETGRNSLGRGVIHHEQPGALSATHRRFARIGDPSVPHEGTADLPPGRAPRQKKRRWIGSLGQSGRGQGRARWDPTMAAGGSHLPRQHDRPKRHSAAHPGATSSCAHRIRYRTGSVNVANMSSPDLKGHRVSDRIEYPSRNSISEISLYTPYTRTPAMIACTNVASGHGKTGMQPTIRSVAGSAKR